MDDPSKSYFDKSLIPLPGKINAKMGFWESGMVSSHCLSLLCALRIGRCDISCLYFCLFLPLISSQHQNLKIMALFTFSCCFLLFIDNSGYLTVDSKDLGKMSRAKACNLLFTPRIPYLVFLNFELVFLTLVKY